MIGEGIVSKQTSVPGWHSDLEAETLIQLTQEYVPHNSGVVVEIGGEYGKSASEFGYALKNKERAFIYTVDLFPTTHHLAAQYGGLLNVWRANIAETGLGSGNLHIVPVPGSSQAVADSWEMPIDLLFIDAGHTYEDVKRDIAAWVGHVKAGGIIIFHDYAKVENPNAHPLHYEVKAAVDEWYDNRTEKLERIDLPDSLIAFKKFEPAKKADHESQTAVESSASTPEKPAKKTRKSRKVK